MSVGIGLGNTPALPEVDDKGAILDMETDDNGITEFEDGSAEVELDEIDDLTMVGVAGEFYDNLADAISLSAQQTISVQLMDLIAKDKDARSRRDEQYEEGIRRTGLGDDAPGGASFKGANKVVHPMLTKACVDFSARAIKELWPRNGPNSGPIKDSIVGEPTREKMARAHRKVNWLNYQVTQQMPEFRSELEQMLTQLPLGGVQYLKLAYDRRVRRPRAYFLPVDEVYVPFAAASFASAERKTHAQQITELEYQRRVKTGMYLDTKLHAPAMPEDSASATASHKVEGKEGNSENDDGLRTIFEVYCHLELEEDTMTDGEPAPYIVSIDENTEQVLAIYRNWSPEDDLLTELDWIVEWPFVPWRGAYPIGLTHMIGGLSGAATGALRALLDSAHIANSQTLAKLKGGSRGGQRISLEPTQVHEIEGTPATDDIRKLLMPLPFNQPSPVLFSLLGFLVESGESVVQTTMANIADQPANMPVGTTLALIEQGMTVFNGIHARLHDAMARTIKVLHRINAMYLEETDVIEATGERMVRRADFEGPMDVVPVSDPNIFSEMQRMAQMQVVQQRADVHPELYDARAVEELILEQTKIPDVKKLLIAKPEPAKLNPINENLAAALGRPVVAFPDQDHMAHLQAHVQFMLNPVLGNNPLIAPTITPAMLQHVKEHILYLYVQAVVDKGTEALGNDLTAFMDKDEEVNNEFDRLLTQVSFVTGQQIQQPLQPVMAWVQQAMQYMQQMQSSAPPPPMTPEQVAAMEVDRKTKADQANAQAKAQDQQIKVQQLQQKDTADQARVAATRDQGLSRIQSEMARNQSEERRVQAQIDSKEAVNTQDNQTALVIASMREASGGNDGDLKNGHGLNPNPGA